ncbi:MAG TPA: endonuclease/exonuclease/phosphatase family protein [Acidimicrobiales bacterium]|nr:endonuclease/exonuclease/phosphatase family protein [Acidimicrobiales bacterium]
MGETPRVHRPFTIVAAGALALLLATTVACGGDDGDDAGPSSSSGPPTTADGGAGGEAGTLEVLTYNVAGLPQEISQENPEENIPKISPLLQPFDLVLTQEDFDYWVPGGLADGLDFTHYHERLLADSGQPHSLDRHPGAEAVGLDLATRPNLQAGDGIGIMSQLALADQERVPWADCFGELDPSDGGAADCLAMKGFAVATVTLGGVEVDVYSLHGEAGSSPDDQRLQAEDYEQLAAFIEERSAGRPIILGGDTNLHLDPEHEDSGGDADATIWADFLERTGLVDACDEVGCDDTHIIDKVAVRSSDDLTLTAEAHDIPRDTFVDEDGEDLSDHAPVHVTIGWSLAG